MDLLPSLAPRDSHTLWYTSAHTSNSDLNHSDPSQNAFDHLFANAGQASGQHAHRRPHHNNLHRTALARLRLDEEYTERRKQNVQNYGNSWIKPPGIQKSLYQQREEKREMEEHQEALRREQLAQELAEAEGAEGLLQGEGGDDEMDEARDLDDDVPDAETTGLEADEDGGSESEEEDHDVDEVPRGVLATRMPDDVYREALIRGEEVIRQTEFGDEADSTIDEVDQSQMLEEEDLVHETGVGRDADMGEDMDMDMGADLDADIPEAESLGGYEHTDTDEELSSSAEESESQDYGSNGIPAASSMVRSDGTQSSTGQLDSMLSRATQGSSSQMGSSPGQLSGLRGRRTGQ